MEQVATQEPQSAQVPVLGHMHELVREERTIGEPLWPGEPDVPADGHRATMSRMQVPGDGPAAVEPDPSQHDAGIDQARRAEPGAILGGDGDGPHQKAIGAAGSRGISEGRDFRDRACRAIRALP